MSAMVVNCVDRKFLKEDNERLILQVGVKIAALEYSLAAYKIQRLTSSNKNMPSCWCAGTKA